jgi:iron complex transport system substrate-binding protein
MAKLILFICILFLSCEKHSPPAAAVVPLRIISLAPSITETIFALGKEDRLVGVTRFCAYPPQAKQKFQLGGYTDPSYEAILSLKPDLVLLLKEHEPVMNFLKANHIQFVNVDNHDIAGIIASIDTIGRICNVGILAESLSVEIKKILPCTSISSETRPSVLFCVGREAHGSGSVGEVWVAGRKSIYNELLNAACARNIIADSTFDYPTLTSEGIIRLQPDIIIEITNHVPDADTGVLKKDWLKMSMVPAVKNSMIFFLEKDYVTVPGPRIVLLFNDIKGIVAEYENSRNGFK